MAISIGEIEATLRLRDELTSRLKLAQQQLEKTGDNLQRIGRQVREAGSVLTVGLTVPLVAAGGAALKFSADFQTAMTKVGNLTDIGIDGISDMRKEILRLSPAVGVGPKELAEGLLVVASTGLKGAAALAVLEASAKGTAVGLGDTKEIARAVTSAILAYGEENLSAAEATNKLFVAVREGGAEADEFAGTLGRVVGIASQVGVSFDEVLASMATFTRLGVKADEAATALRGVMATLLKPSKGAAEALASVGLSVEQLRKNVKEKGLSSALIELVELTKDNDEAMAAIIPNVRALSGVLGTAGAQGDALKDVLANIKNGTTELDDAFEVVSKTLGFRFNAAMAKAQGILLKFGDAIAPAFGELLRLAEPVLSFVSRLADSFAGLPGPVKMAAVVVGLFLAALGPVVYIFGSFIQMAGFAAAGLAALTTWFGLSTVAAGAHTRAMAADAVATTAQAAATTTAATALKFAAGEQLAFGFMAAEGAQMTLPLSGAIAQTGIAAAEAAPGIGLAATAISGLEVAAAAVFSPIAAFIGLGAGIITLSGSWSEIGRILKAVAEIIQNSVLAAFDSFISDVKTMGAVVAQYGGPIVSWLDKFLGVTRDLKGIKKVLGDAAEGLERLAGASKRPVDSDILDSAKKVMEDLKKAQLAASAGGIDFEKTLAPGVSLDEMAASTKSLTERIAEARAAVAHLTGEQRANISAGREMGLSVEDITQALNSQWPELRLTTASVQLYKEQLEDAAKASDKLHESLKVIHAATIPLTKGQENVIRALHALGVDNDTLATSMKVSKIRIDQFTGGIDDMKKAIDSVDVGQVDLSALLMTNAQRHAAAEELDIMQKMVAFRQSIPEQSIEQGMGMLQETFLKQGPDVLLLKTGQRALAGLRDTLKAAPQVIAQAFTGGGGLKGAGSALGSMLGSSILGNVFGKPGDKTGLLKSMTGLFGEVMGEALPVIGALLGPVIDIILKAFDHKKKDFQRMGRELGVKLSDGLIDQMKTDAKKFGGEMQALLLNLDKVIAEAGGIAAFGVDKAIAKARDLFVMLDAGALAAKDVGGVFDRVFAQILPAAIDKTTGLASKAFLELIDLAHRFGIESEAATKFLSDMAAKTTSGLNLIAAGTVGAFTGASKTIGETAEALEKAQTKVATLKAKIADLLGSKSGVNTEKERVSLASWRKELIDAQTEVANLTRKQSEQLKTLNSALVDGQENFDRLGRLAGVAFAAALGSGRTFLEALDDVGPTLDIASEAQRTFGFTSSGTFAELMKFRQFAEDNKELVGTLDGVNKMMSGLQNSGALTQGTFDDLNAVATDTFKKMVAGGLTSRQALALMQPTLQTIWQLQHDFGFEVDASTQALIDQGVEAGIVGEQHRTAADRMVRALEHVDEIITLLAEHLGVKIPEAAQAAADGIDDAFDGKRIEIPVTFPTEFPEFPGLPEGAHARLGGSVTQMGIKRFREGGPVGNDTIPAYLSPGELVLTRDDRQALFDGMRDQRGGGDTYVTIHAIDTQSFRDAMRKPGGGVDIFIEEIQRDKRGRGSKLRRTTD